MNLLEYQAKELFQQVGIPILPSQRIDHPRDLKGLKVSYPVVLKSQVYSGGRAKLGGIRFVENTIDAVAAAQAIFHLPIMGQYPQVVLAEAKYDPDQELYLAIVIDQCSRRPVLLGSRQGGVEVESFAQQMQQVIVDQEFSPFYARRLAILMNLSGELITSVSSILEKMYWLFIHKDLDLIEINPLAVDPAGKLMALDGKVSVNDGALGRHPDLLALKEKIPLNGMELKVDLDLAELAGNIGIVCNGAGLTMATLDMVNKAGGKPASFLNLGGEFRHDMPPGTLQARLQQGLEIVTQNRNIRVILVNLFGNVVSCKQIADTLVTYLRRRSRQNRAFPPLVVRLVGRHLEQARETLLNLDLSLVDSLDEAIAEAVALSQTKPTGTAGRKT
jgi:succinyl-CoA synthetase beta subunit